MPSGIYGKSVSPLSQLIPGVEEASAKCGNPGYGQMVVVSFPIGAPLLVDSATYKQALFIAPSDGCLIVDGWLSAAVAIGGGTNTIAFDNYDASANAARNVQSATNIDPKTASTSKEGLHLTLSATVANLKMDEGDVLNVTLVCGTMTTDGEGLVATFLIWVPYPAGI
jgi:hypothetical protein